MIKTINHHTSINEAILSLHPGDTLILENGIYNEKVEVNKKHIELYDKALGVAEYLLNQYMKDALLVEAGKIKRGRATATNIDYLVSAIQKAQKGQRLALNIDNADVVDNTEPEIVIIEGIDLKKI